MADAGTAALLPWLVALAVVVGGAAGAAGAVVMLWRAARGTSPVDQPDERRLHTQPTPRGGGVGIFAAGLLVLPVALVCASGAREADVITVIVLAWALPCGALGLIDDHRPVRVATKLIVQFAFASLAVALGLRIEVLDLAPFVAIELGWAAWPLSVLGLVWATNLFNFMDGMDGLAGGAGSVFLCAFAVFAVGVGAPGVAALALGLAAACVGFLQFNWPPARIFMGDAGSLSLGAVLGGFTVALTSELSRAGAGTVPIVVPLIATAPFVWDATYTVVRNARRGLSQLVRPHRRHIYQRMVLAGWPQSSVRRLYLGSCVGLSASAVAWAAVGPYLQAALEGVALGTCGALSWIAGRSERLD